jgi:hypothetical protein
MMREEDFEGEGVESSLAPMGEFLPIEEKGDDFRMRRDGDEIEVEFGDEFDDSPVVDLEHFDENLAVHLSAGERQSLASDLIDKVEADEASRSDWTERMKDGLETIGVKDCGASTIFDGASRVNHPMILEAMVQFQSRAIEEMFPPGGPVKTMVMGDETEETRQQAERVETFMNYQLTELDERHFWDTDSMLMYLPYAGSAFKKVTYSKIDRYTTSRFVKAHSLIVPYDATSLEDSPRYTHRYPLSQRDYEVLVKEGELLELTQRLDSQIELSAARELEDEADLRTPSRDEEDDTPLDIHEVYCYHRFEWDSEDDLPKPYLITLEKNTGEVLSIRRNWEPDDDMYRKVINFVHYKYLPGLGFYGFGLIHLIGSLGRAASGALRLLLDGATTASLQGGFKSKDLKSIAGELRFTPGQWKDVDATAEEMAKGFYTPPFKEPSPALFNTLEILLNTSQRFMSTTEAMTGDQSNTGPVGTTLAIIEQGSKIFSAIHKRMHVAARREFKLIARFNHLYMDEDYPYNLAGKKRHVLRDDFDDRVDVIPVSDPNIFSNTQRIAIAQAALELIQNAPHVYDEQAVRRAHGAMLRALRVPEVEAYLPERRERRLDPVTENQLLITGRQGVHAFPEQDHEAHMAVHQMFAQEIANLGDEQMMQALMGPLQAHLAEHIAHGYRLKIEQQLGIPLPPVDWQNFENVEDMPVELDNAVARAVAMNIQPPEPPEQEMSEEEMAAQQAQAEGRMGLESAAFDEQRKDLSMAAEQRRKDEAAKAELRRRALRDGLLPSEVRAAERAFDAGREE